MKVLIAEDDQVSRRILESTLQRKGYEVVPTVNGAEAWEVLQSEHSPRLAILDWMMPEMDGPQVCRRVRAREAEGYVYVILLTARADKQDIVMGLEAGADDYLVKPFDSQELQSRVKVGERVLNLESALEGKVRELQDALKHVQQLQGLLPICMHCKNVRDDKDSWHRIEGYIEQHSQAMFTHSLCNDCMAKYYREPSEGGKT